jgi:hypothetical protein
MLVGPDPSGSSGPILRPSPWVSELAGQPRLGVAGPGVLRSVLSVENGSYERRTPINTLRIGGGVPFLRVSMAPVYAQQGRS